MDKLPFHISVVMPVYNEAEIIGQVIADYVKNVCDYFEQAEFIIVNDRSTDNTEEILSEAQSKYPCVKVLNNEHNMGHGRSLLRAFEHAKGDYVFQDDSDNQFFTEDSRVLFDRMQKSDCDLVIGWRKARDDSFHRKLVSFLGRSLIYLFLGFEVKDSNSPFRIYKKSALDKILPVMYELKPFFPSILMVITAKKLGMNVQEVSVRHKTRLTGKTFIRSFKIIKLCWVAVKEVFQLKSKLRNLSYEKNIK